MGENDFVLLAGFPNSLPREIRKFPLMQKMKHILDQLTIKPNVNCIKVTESLKFNDNRNAA